MRQDDGDGEQLLGNLGIPRVEIERRRLRFSSVPGGARGRVAPPTIKPAHLSLTFPDGSTVQHLCALCPWVRALCELLSTGYGILGGRWSISWWRVKCPSGGLCVLLGMAFVARSRDGRLAFCYNASLIAING